MIQCPECRQMIPDDSAFCDQCGKELKWCPDCKRPKRGTECPVCGSDLIPGRKWLVGSVAVEEAHQRHGEREERCDDREPSGRGGAVAGACPLGGSCEAAGGDSQSVDQQDGGGATELVGNGWRLALAPGQFGRAGGIWPELSTCPYVSGRHGTISGAAGNWSITDIGSTNGTFVDGVHLQTGVATPLKKGSKVRIATLDFTVE